MPFAGTTKPMAADDRRADPEPHLAAAARGHRHGRISAAGECRQRAAALHDIETVAAPAADLRRAKATKALKEALEADPPYDAEVEFDGRGRTVGWNAPALAPWLAKCAGEGRQCAFRQARRVHGRRRLDPVHGACWARDIPRRSSSSPASWVRIPTPTAPTNSSHIPTAKKISACIATMLADHAAQTMSLLTADENPASGAAASARVPPRHAAGRRGASLFTEPNIATWYAGLVKPALHAAELDIRAGMDHALCADGGRGVAGMARRRHDVGGDDALFPPAHLEFRLDR